MCKESKKTEVKDLEWAKKELKEVLDIDIPVYQIFDRGYQNGVSNSLDILNQLDEPETLSQNWIDKFTSPADDEGRLYVWKSDLQNLLVPKQIKPKELYKAITGISPSIEEVCDSSGTETFLGESVSVERIIEEIMKVFESSGSEITEEPETVASVIVDFSRSVTRLKEVLNMEVEDLEE